MGLSGIAFVQVEGKLKLVETNYFLRWARTSICPKSTARSKAMSCVIFSVFVVGNIAN